MAKTVSGGIEDLGASSKGADADRDPVGEAGRAAKELALKIHNLSIGNDDVVVGGGLVADAAAQSRAAQAGSSEKKKKDKRDREHMQYVLMLQQQLADIDRELAKIDKGLSALDKIEQAIRNGTFDRNNPDHQAWLRDARLKASDIPDDRDTALAVVSDQRSDFQKIRDGLAAKRREVETGIVEAGGTPESHDEARARLEQEDKALSYEIYDASGDEKLKEIARDVFTDAEEIRLDHNASLETSLAGLSVAGMLSGDGSYSQGIVSHADRSMNLTSDFNAKSLDRVAVGAENVARISEKISFTIS